MYRRISRNFEYVLGRGGGEITPYKQTLSGRGGTKTDIVEEFKRNSIAVRTANDSAGCIGIQRVTTWKIGTEIVGEDAALEGGGCRRRYLEISR